MNQESYLKEVEKYLNCRKAQKKQIRRDLEADICAASERGESWEEIRDRMGGPRELAQEFNENMGSGSTGRKMKRSRKILLICGIVVAVLAVLIAAAYWFLPKSYLIENSEIFDAETVAEESEEIVSCLYSKTQIVILLVRDRLEREKPFEKMNMEENENED